MMNLGKCFITDESGSTAIEYALVAAGIALTALTTLTVGWHPCLRPIRRGCRQPQCSGPRVIKIGVVRNGASAHKRTRFRANGKPLSQEALNRP